MAQTHATDAILLLYQENERMVIVSVAGTSITGGKLARNDQPLLAALEHWNNTASTTDVTTHMRRIFYAIQVLCHTTQFFSAVEKKYNTEMHAQEVLAD